MEKPQLAILVQAVQKSRKYHDVSPDLIHRIGLQELQIRKNLKAAIKSTKNKLHQVGGAYSAKAESYHTFITRLEIAQQKDQSVRPLCQQIMAGHSSTAERLPILDSFYNDIFTALPPIHSVLDLACGLNPLAWPWMGLSPEVQYTAIDIYAEMMAFIQKFFEMQGINGRARQQDILGSLPETAVDLALILKTMPCLEQINKEAGHQLLDNLHARYLLISYPLQSLTGRDKGMRQHYTAHFDQLAAGRSWQNVTPFQYESELAFLVQV